MQGAQCVQDILFGLQISQRSAESNSYRPQFTRTAPSQRIPVTQTVACPMLTPAVAKTLARSWFKGAASAETIVLTACVSPEGKPRLRPPIETLRLRLLSSCCTSDV